MSSERRFQFLHSAADRKSAERVPLQYTASDMCPRSGQLAKPDEACEQRRPQQSSKHRSTSQAAARQATQRFSVIAATIELVINKCVQFKGLFDTVIDSASVGRQAYSREQGRFFEHPEKVRLEKLGFHGQSQRLDAAARRWRLRGRSWSKPTGIACKAWR